MVSSLNEQLKQLQQMSDRDSSRASHAEEELKALKYKLALAEATNFELENKLEEATLLYSSTEINLAEKSLEKIYLPTAKEMIGEQPPQPTDKSKTEKVFRTIHMNLSEP